MSTGNSTSFEKSLKDLEKVVTQLEQGDLPLEKAITLYQKGMDYVKKCEQQLDQAKLKIQQTKVG